jgi:O-antigen/teichoic acid export membrane protein
MEVAETPLVEELSDGSRAGGVSLDRARHDQTDGLGQVRGEGKRRDECPGTGGHLVEAWKDSSGQTSPTVAPGERPAAGEGLAAGEGTAPGGGELQTLARGGMLSLAGVVTNAVLTFAFFVVAARLLGGRNAGALFEGMAVLAICTYAAMFGGDYGVLKLMPTVRRESAGSELRLVVAALVPPIVVGLVICVALLTARTEITDAIVRRGNQLGTQHVLVVFAPFVPIAAVTQVACAAMRTWSIRDMVLVQNVFLPSSRLVLLLLVAQFRLTPPTAAVAWAAPLAVCAAIACAYLLSKCLREHRRVGAVPADGSTRRVALALWKFSGPRSLGGIFQILIAWLDVLLVGALASSSQSAAYAVASRYVITATFALNAIGIAIAPQLGRIFDRGDSKSAQMIYRESTWWVMAVTWPALVILVVYAPFMMHIFGRDYAAGIVSLQILGLAMLLNTGTGNNAVALLMGGGSRENLAVNAGALALNVCLNLVLIPRLGAAGAALAWAASIAFTSLTTSLFLHRRTGLLPFGAGYAVVVFSTVVGYGIFALGTRLILGTGVGGTITGVAIGTAVFVALMVRFRSVLRLSDLRRLGLGSDTG